MAQNKYELKIIKQAYLKLKRDIYYDQINLFLRNPMCQGSCRLN